MYTPPGTSNEKLCVQPALQVEVGPSDIVCKPQPPTDPTAQSQAHAAAISGFRRARTLRPSAECRSLRPAVVRGYVHR
jgi:hypothetical protein